MPAQGADDVAEEAGHQGGYDPKVVDVFFQRPQQFGRFLIAVQPPQDEGPDKQKEEKLEALCVALFQSLFLFKLATNLFTFAVLFSLQCYKMLLCQPKYYKRPNHGR